MLTSIPRFAGVLEANVGPRFDEYKTYTRPGVSLRVVAAAVAFEQPGVSFDDAAFVKVKEYHPFGYVTASAGVITPVPKYKSYRTEGKQTIARAAIIGVPLQQDFGFCL